LSFANNYLTRKSVWFELGYMSYGFITVKYGKLHYRNLEHVKIRALVTSHGNFDTFTELTPDSIDEINWWKNNIFDAYDDIIKENPVLVLTTDASLTGWVQLLILTNVGVCYTLMS